MKEMTLKEQLKAVNLADEASQHSLIESCSNLHFLTLAYLATSPSVKVRQRILLCEDLHVVVLKVLESTMPANLKELVRNHKSYKVKKADELNLREFVLSCQDAMDSVEWYDPGYTEVLENADYPKWQRKFILGGNITKIYEKLDWVNFTPENIRLLLIVYALLRNIPRSLAKAMKFHVFGAKLLRKLRDMSFLADEETEALVCFLYACGAFDLVAFSEAFPRCISEIFPVMKAFANSVN